MQLQAYLDVGGFASTGKNTRGSAPGTHVGVGPTVLVGRAPSVDVGVGVRVGVDVAPAVPVRVGVLVGVRVAVLVGVDVEHGNQPESVSLIGPQPQSLHAETL